MIDSPAFFRRAFEALTGYEPFRWQVRLFDRLLKGDIPSACNIPTGLGKTSVIPIWLIAMASQIAHECVTIPRRLVYIVNRRTVVDQATTVAEQMRQRLLYPDDSGWSVHAEILRSLTQWLKDLAATEEVPLAVSTLRGEFADNEQWKADPARPAIIIGTIDMIGSKLLFSGYGDGRYGCAHHAGLIGQDVLIVHDEAHLTPTFSDLLRGVADAQDQIKEPRPIKVMELSATSHSGNSDRNGAVLGLESEDEEDLIVKERLDATKRLHLHNVNEAAIIGEFVRLAEAYDNKQAKVLIYVRSPEDAQKVGDQLKNGLGSGGDGRVALLTGTIRGHERDQLLKANPVYRAMLDHGSTVERTVYLVSTSAGEVGVDLDADHIICDLTTLDSMIQRLGRVNRCGGAGRVARVDVVADWSESKSQDKTQDLEQAVRSTQAILKRWVDDSTDELNTSPRCLRRLVDSLDDGERRRAFSPKPAAPLLTDILLDAWSLTSVTAPMPGRPEVAPYLHGLTNDPPETHVAWRKEVIALDRANASNEALREWFDACRIEARERLRDRTDRVKKTLEGLLSTHRKKDARCDFPVVLLNERGEAEWSRLSQITEKKYDLAYSTIILPIEAGGLNAHGMLDAKTEENAIDVAEYEDPRERWLLTKSKDGERYERLMTGKTAKSFPQGLRELGQVTLCEHEEGAEDEGESRCLLLLVPPKELAIKNPEATKTRLALGDHTCRIVDFMKRIADALWPEGPLREALTKAAEWHDRGKDRAVWQRYARNPDPTNPLAKSTEYLHSCALGGYRHEFGSLLEAGADSQIKDHPERDLILHLITAHHGWARPHFKPEAYDLPPTTTAKNEETAAEVMRRFGRLQQRFGRWGLAWLESLVRAADILASQNPTNSVQEMEE